MTGSVLNVGLIGAGRIGRVHARNLAQRLPRARLVMVADVAEDAARRCAADNDVGVAVADYRAVLDSPQVDAVVVCSATDTHARVIEQAAAAGKHVFCEKPIDLTMERIDAALAAVQRRGIKLQIGFNRRFDANHRRARQAVERGEIGELWRLHLVSRDPSPPTLEYIRGSGGLFLDMTIHDFDMARFLVGAEVAEVFATAEVLVDAGIGGAGDVDTAVTLLRFENGVIGSIDNSRRAVYGYDQRVELFGSGGMLTTSNKFESNAVISDRHSVHRDLPLHFFIERYADSYLAEMSSFVECVLEDHPPAVSGADGRAAAVLGLVAQRSAREKRMLRVDEVDF